MQSISNTSKASQVLLHQPHHSKTENHLTLSKITALAFLVLLAAPFAAAAKALTDKTVVVHNPVQQDGAFVLSPEQFGVVSNENPEAQIPTNEVEANEAGKKGHWTIMTGSFTDAELREFESKNPNGKISSEQLKELLEHNKTEIIDNPIEMAARLEKFATDDTPERQYELGKMYLEGTNGIPKNPKRAIECFQKAADKKHPMALLMLGLMYRDGSIGVEKDVKKGSLLIQEAANLNEPLALYQIGVMHKEGSETHPQDMTKAYNHFMKAAVQELPMAQLAVGTMHKEGWGVQKDFKKAFEWFKLAADQGNAQAQYAIGDGYYSGNLGIKKDLKKGVEYLEKAANQGHSLAEITMAQLSETGSPGLEKNPDKAINWHLKAAKHGFHESLYHVGRLYLNQIVGVQDLTQRKKAIELALTSLNLAKEKGVDIEFKPLDFPTLKEFIGQAYVEKGYLYNELYMEKSINAKDRTDNFDMMYLSFRNAADQGNLEANDILRQLDEQLPPTNL